MHARICWVGFVESRLDSTRLKVAATLHTRRKSGCRQTLAGGVLDPRVQRSRSLRTWRYRLLPLLNGHGRQVAATRDDRAVEYFGRYRQYNGKLRAALALSIAG